MRKTPPPSKSAESWIIGLISEPMILLVDFVARGVACGDPWVGGLKPKAIVPHCVRHFSFLSTLASKLATLLEMKNAPFGALLFWVLRRERDSQSGISGLANVWFKCVFEFIVFIIYLSYFRVYFRVKLAQTLYRRTFRAIWFVLIHNLIFNAYSNNS